MPTSPITPSVEQWRGMTRAQRDAFLADALLALQQEAELMPEGVPHIRSKFGIREVLRDYYARMGRKIYLGTELPIHYPGEPGFAPDFHAVLDVEDPGDADTRMAWVVADEGKGLDLVLEVLHAGDRRKDLVDNVLFYARLGIPEYFVYDRRKYHVHGFRLPAPGATRYVPIQSRGGFLSSNVLGLDLGVSDGRLRFYHVGAEVPETRDLLLRATAMIDALERRADEEAQRADAESRRADEEAAARAELERRLAELLGSSR